MKKVVEVSIGSVKFTLEDDAYFRLNTYLKRFEATITDPSEVKEVMEDVEARVAEILQKEQEFSNQVIDTKRVQVVIDHLGEVEMDEASKEYSSQSAYNADGSQAFAKGDKKLMRSEDEKMISGVCGGLAAYFNIDVTLVRIVFVLLFFAYGMAGIAYIIIWIIAPKAETVAQKLEMRGFAPTAENIRKYTSNNKA